MKRCSPRPTASSSAATPTHVAFGFGEHFCLGAKLARLEARVFLEELFARFDHVEVTGAPRRLRSNLIETA